MGQNNQRMLTSSLSEDQKRKLMDLLGDVSLCLLYKASVHGYTAAAFHSRCDNKGPTVIMAYNRAGFVFGAYTHRSYTQTQENIHDERAFLYSINTQRNIQLKVFSDGGVSFTDARTGPDYGALVFLHGNRAEIQSFPGRNYTFVEEEMHGNDLWLTEFEVHSVEGLGGLWERLENPWRNIQWTEERKEQLIQIIENYNPESVSVNQTKVLLLGPITSGKSTFFNSINSIFRGRMMVQSMCGTMPHSMTTQFRTYSIRNRNGGELPIILCDTRGLETTEAGRLSMEEDIVSIYKGHVADRYQFNPTQPLRTGMPGYRNDVSLKDQIHCVVYVIDSSILMSNEQKNMLTEIRRRTIQMDIPQLVLMTKVDKACPLVRKDIKNVYFSRYLKRKAEQISEDLGIPLSYVFPVKNYSHEAELDSNVDILLLSAVVQMLNHTDSFLENQVGE